MRIKLNIGFLKLISDRLAVVQLAVASLSISFLGWSLTRTGTVPLSLMHCFLLHNVKC